jgi:ribosome-associated toxin RatA of RatAB toxin-antitoxin module
MPKFSFTKLVNIDRDKFFAISTDYEKFTKILPEYFLELRIIEKKGNMTTIFETLRFLGKTVNVTTEHIVENPDRHIVKMLDGQAKGTIFDETYEKVGEQTKVTIKVDFVLSGGLKILGVFAKNKIENSMKMVLDEFATYAKNQSQC